MLAVDQSFEADQNPNDETRDYAIEQHAQDVGTGLGAEAVELGNEKIPGCEPAQQQRQYPGAEPADVGATSGARLTASLRAARASDAIPATIWPMSCTMAS